MWAEACEMLERAQRLQRQFFRFGHAVEAQPRWEPPVDIVAYEPDVHVTVALPGVAPERVEVRVANGALYIAAVRVPPLGRETTAVHSVWPVRTTGRVTPRAIRVAGPRFSEWLSRVAFDETLKRQQLELE
jgi:HSP20 family molecular chaperone IbpA